MFVRSAYYYYSPSGENKNNNKSQLRNFLSVNVVKNYLALMFRQNKLGHLSLTNIFIPETETL
jgi:hypothetical protein